MTRFTHVLWCGLCFIAASFAQWTKPNARLPSFSDTYTVGEHIIVSWLELNDSTNDLWLTRFDTTSDSFSVRLATSQNIAQPASFDWTIAINATEVLEDTRFILQFLPVGAEYNATAEPSIPSPPFNLIVVNQAAPPNGTAGAPSVPATSPGASTTVVATPSTDSGAQPTNEVSNQELTGLSQPAKIGIGVGAAGFTIITSLLMAALAIKRHKVRRNANEDDGPYEVLGDKKFAMELSSKESTIHELNSNRENSVSEAGGSPIHEIATVIKRPGLHELPS